MKNYTIENEPVFSESIRVTETSDPAHAENINVAPKQLLENTLANRNVIKEIEKGEQEITFEDYTEEGVSIPEAEEAISQVTSGKKDKLFRQYVKAALKGLLVLAQRALAISMGKNQARVFVTVTALDTWLAVPENVAKLNVGDNFYITATDVPDYWWDGKQKQKLETQKVDLSTYDREIAALKQKNSELSGNISSHSHAWSSITEKPSTFSPSSHNHNDQYYTESEMNNKLAGKANLLTTSVIESTSNSAPKSWPVINLKAIPPAGYHSLGIIGIDNNLNFGEVALVKYIMWGNDIYVALRNLEETTIKYTLKVLVLWIHD